MRFDIDRVLLENIQQFGHQAEKVLIVRLLPLRPGDRGHQVAAGMLDRVEIVGREECADRRTTNHHPFKWKGMHDDFHVSASEQIAAEHHTDGNHQSQNRIHVQPPPRPSGRKPLSSFSSPRVRAGSSQQLAHRASMPGDLSNFPFRRSRSRPALSWFQRIASACRFRRPASPERRQP